MRHGTAILFLVATTLPFAARAGEPESDVRRRYALMFDDENDWFGKWSDKYYTNGTRIAWTSPDWFSAPGDDTLRRLSLSLAQEIYTPKGGSSAIPATGDHPYESFLYAGAGFSWETSDSLTAVELQVGVSGPSAGGKQIQQAWHHVIRSATLNGWDTQSGDRAIAGLVLEHRRRYALGGDASFGADVLPRVALIGGNMRTEAVAGARLRFGQNLPSDFGGGYLRQSVAHAAPRPHTEESSLYGYLDVQAEAVAVNLALDAGDSRAVDIVPVVGQFSLGLCYAAGPYYRVQLFQSLRTREFRTQDRDVFLFGGLSATLSL